ncbi:MULTISPECIES: hypothetical protein [Acinetobacter]|uniref:hypothetical protein n=1 Tax=Acinetobacter TaxID=469 RepID=UPI000B3CE64D|nr:MULTISPECIES: hypothetical protein [Acinetobacter]AXY59109.1 hypothetical protein CDG61_03045 [Acinetobacter sp. WCHAc010052]WOE41140.1 hypothetical protein QSG87_14950 [Acinetobacter chinensis]
MFENTKQLIERIGETDQLYLKNNTPELALERGDLRLQLVERSNSRQEQVHFLQEAIVLFETARVEYEEMPMPLYVNLSLHLAKAYMVYFELSKETRYALITQQILKPMTQHESADIYFMLAYASVSKNELSLTRHWLKKYMATADFDLVLLKQHPAFKPVQNEAWFSQMIQDRLH